MHIVIAGAGISGLSAAYYTYKQFQALGMDVDITIIDQAKEPGGKIRTLHKHHCVIECGPDSFLARKQPIIDLTFELGLEDELVATNPALKPASIVHHNQLHPIPQGFILGIPTRLRPLLQTSLLSPWGKARAVLDFIRPRRRVLDDEALGQFFERRLGKEIHEQVAEPLLSGIYAGNTDELSVQATFPQFHQLEQSHRSIIRGMIHSQNSAKRASILSDELKRSVFLTYRGGLSTLVNRLVDEAKRFGNFRMNTRIASMERVQNRYQLVMDDGSVVHADGVVLTLPAPETAKIIQDRALDKVKQLEQIQYVSVANVVLAFDETKLQHKLDRSGFVVPRTEGRFITACTWTSVKWLHTAPEGKVLMRCYVGRSGQEQWRHMEDAQIIRHVLQDVRDLTGFAGLPEFTEVTRWERAMPQYAIGHLQLVQEAKRQLAQQWPGVFVAGAAYDGVGIPDCIRQGKEVAEQFGPHL